MSNSGFDTGVRKMARAIAKAEGFGKIGAIPTRAHNPGDLVIPGWKGDKLGAEGISVFADDEAGWRALAKQIQLIADGKSHVYTPTMSILEMAKKWTATEQIIWAENVAAHLRNFEGMPNVVSSTIIRTILDEV